MPVHRSRINRNLQAIAQEASRLAGLPHDDELAFATQALAEKALQIALQAARLDEANEHQTEGEL